jgi:hypothetical protein
MTSPKPYEVALRLNNIRDLFHEPARRIEG